MATKRSIQTFMSAQKKLELDNKNNKNISNIINTNDNNNNITNNNTNIVQPIVKELIDKIVDNVVEYAISRELIVTKELIETVETEKFIEPQPTEINHETTIIIPEDYFPVNLNENEKYNISIVDSNTKVYYITETIDTETMNNTLSNNKLNEERVTDTKISGKFNYIVGLPIKSNEKTVFYTYFNSIMFSRSYKNSYDYKFSNDLELITPEKITFEIKSKLSDENKIVLNVMLQFKKLFENINTNNNTNNTNNTDNPNDPNNNTDNPNNTKLPEIVEKISKIKEVSNEIKKESKPEKKQNAINNSNNINYNTNNKPPNYSIETLLNIMNKKLTNFVR
jgi:hypothetical protein